MKHIVCYSGGHSSALVAIEVVKRYGNKNVVLLNHNISSKVEHEDIKRFKYEVASYLEIPITYANMDDFEEMTPIMCMKRGGGNSVGLIHCTRMLKTAPFYNYLETVCKDKENYIIYYGFDNEEPYRISRRTDVMRSMGYKVEFPLAYWPRTIYEIEEIGISRPKTYSVFKHANCVGCLKAGKQHWYVVYCLRNDIFKEALEVEEELGFSIIKGVFLKDLVEQFESLKAMGICPNDKANSNTFWAGVNNVMPEQINFMPCDCSFI